MVFMIGCNHQNGTTIHPTEINIPTPGGENNHVIDAQKISFDDSGLALRIQSFENLLRLGYQSDGIDDYLFGSISDIVIDRRNRVYILDVNRQEISVFDQKGNYITTLGRRGKGPEEYEHARTMTITDQDLLLVNSSYEIEVFDISKAEIEFNQTVQLDGISRSICAIGNRLFVHYSGLLSQEKEFKDDGGLNMIQAYSIPDFQPLFSFGDAYKSENIAVIDRFSLGEVSCNKATSTVVFGFERFPVLQGYTLEGALKWKTYISGLKTTKLEEINESGRTKITYSPPVGSLRDRILKSRSFFKNYQLLQIDRIVMDEEEFSNKREVLSYIIDSKNGEGGRVDKDIPLLFGISKDIAVSVDEVFTESAMYRIPE